MDQRLPLCHFPRRWVLPMPLGPQHLLGCHGDHAAAVAAGAPHDRRLLRLGHRQVGSPAEVRQQGAQEQVQQEKCPPQLPPLVRPLQPGLDATRLLRCQSMGGWAVRELWGGPARSQRLELQCRASVGGCGESESVVSEEQWVRRACWPDARGASLNCVRVDVCCHHMASVRVKFDVGCACVLRLCGHCASIFLPQISD